MNEIVAFIHMLSVELISQSPNACFNSQILVSFLNINNIANIYNILFLEVTSFMGRESLPNLPIVANGECRLWTSFIYLLASTRWTDSAWNNWCHIMLLQQSEAFLALLIDYQMSISDFFQLFFFWGGVFFRISRQFMQT